MDEVGTIVRTKLGKPLPRKIGEGLWRAPVRQVKSEGNFFPRVGYAGLPLNSGKDVYLLGGEQAGRVQNDVWLLRLRPTGAAWVEVSPHREPRRTEAGAGTVVSGKWSGRERFGSALATVRKGCMALYVCGGQTKQAVLEDVWASEDNGSNWYCMAQHPPFGQRMDPGLIAVPGRYEQLVLCGGWTHQETCMQPAGDVWVSTDAGMNWQEIAGAAPWAGRCAPLMAFLPGTTAQGARRLLVFGGTCLTTHQRVNITPGMLADAWELQLELELPAPAASWRRLGDPDLVGGSPGFNGHAVAFDHYASRRAAQPDAGPDHERASFWSEPGALVAGIQGRLCMSSPAEPHEWAPAGPPWPQRGRAQQGIGGDFPVAALASGPRSQIQRLFLFGSHCVCATTDGELRWQHGFLRRVGEASGLPPEIWLARVVPALLPPVPPSPN